MRRLILAKAQRRKVAPFNSQRSSTHGMDVKAHSVASATVESTKPSGALNGIQSSLTRRGNGSLAFRGLKPTAKLIAPLCGVRTSGISEGEIFYDHKERFINRPVDGLRDACHRRSWSI